MKIKADYLYRLIIYRLKRLEAIIKNLKYAYFKNFLLKIFIKASNI